MLILRKAAFVPAIAFVLLLSACGSDNGGPGEIPPPGPKPMM